MNKPKLRSLKTNLRVLKVTTPANIKPLASRALVGRALQNKRKEIYLKQLGRCNHCGEIRNLAAQELDHIVPLHQGGNDDDANLQMLCAEPCHRIKTEKELKVLN